MSDRPPSDNPWFVIAGRWFYDAWNFIQVLSSLTLGAWASQVTGVEWSTPLGPWLFVFAALVFGFGGVWLLRKIVDRLRVVFDRPHPQITVLSSGTGKAVLEIAHFGAPVLYRAEGRVACVLDATERPWPPEHRFACELQPAEGRPNGVRVRLRDGEWAHIVIAESSRASKDDKGHVLWLRRGSYGRQARAPQSGVEMEFVIQGAPGNALEAITRRIRVTHDWEAKTVNAVVIDD